jgi:transposase-like protein
VYRWTRRYDLEHHVNRRPQPGQPYKVEPEVREEIVQNVLDEPFSVVKRIATEHGVHATTIAR